MPLDLIFRLGKANIALPPKNKIYQSDVNYFVDRALIKSIISSY